jgi:hypothetical protein
MKSTFQHYAERFATALDPEAGKPLENNTRLFRRSEDCLAIRLHDTDVVTVFADGRIALDSGGWRTMVTKDRISGYAPVRITSDRGVWYVSHDAARKRAYRKALAEFAIDPQYVDRDGYVRFYDMPGDDERWKLSRKFHARVDEMCRMPFFDGIMFGPGGRCLNGVTPDAWRAYLRERDAMQKRIQTYCTKFNRAMADGLPAPGPGDCWDCSMRVDDGRTLGDLEEDYFVPSLAWNALAAKGYRDVGIMIHLCMNREGTTIGGERWRSNDGSMGGNLFRRALRDYMYDRLLPEPPSERETHRPLRAANSNYP